ncbi:MAG TPA: UDP-N-acetylglucosamine 2-epimerase (non-hydrolyzing) [Candidatus Polarisedimenticolia bacterium]|nr:UDP-N-acetylglucosamine 2-epimerase (non-hydrolyzing) [Candidatus Polarisedimenticolia bacterium]
MKILNIVGARPNFMKIAPLLREMKRHPELNPVLVHTGQHYDAGMSDVFFRDLEISAPDIYLDVGSGTQAVQTGNIMMAFEPIAQEQNPDLVLVVGDVNSTLACSIVSAKLGIPVGHVEAGLRSFDRTMPEEINRVVTDALSEFHFTTSPEAENNLLREGISKEKIYFVGNVMIDTLIHLVQKAESSQVRTSLGVNGDYALLTLHRPSNVDEQEPLKRIFKALSIIARRIPILFPIHPRTARMLKQFEISTEVRGLKLIEPLGYLDFIHLERHARFVLTDSGGIQEETTVLGVPCLTLRNNTERPITIAEGTNVLVGNDVERICNGAEGVLNAKEKTGRVPSLWDGKAAERIVSVLRRVAAQSHS